MKENGKQKTAGLFLVLHVSLLMSSLGGVCSKMAANQKSLIGFALWYGGVLLIMALYALIWQQILKHLFVSAVFRHHSVF